MTVSLEFAAWLLTRLWALLSGTGVLPYPGSESLYNDVRLYYWWAGNIVDGHFPINDPMWQYPPLAAALFTLAYVVGSGQAISGFITMALLADYAIFAMLRRAGEQAREPLATRIWIAVPLAMGPIVLGRFDVFPTAAAVAALLATGSASRGAWLAVGALLKVWPGLGLLAVPRRALPRTLAWFGGTVTVLGGALIAWWPGAFSFLTEQRARGLQVESVAAMPYMLWGAGPGSTVIDYRFGALEVIAEHTWVPSAVMTLTMVVAVAVLVRWRWRGLLDDVPTADVLLTLVLTAMCTSRVLSPQYTVWALGLLAVCAVRPSAHVRQVGVLLVVSALAGQAVYPWLYASYLQGGGVATVVQTIRVTALVWATATCWRATLSAARRSPSRPAAL